MGRILKIGCLGTVALAALVVVLAVAFGGRSGQQQQVVTGQGAKPEAPGPAKVGDTVQLGGWEVTLLDFGPYERFDQRKPATQAQGKLVVADLRIKNLQNRTSNFTTSDFALKAADGREFQPAGQTASIDRGFVISQTVQPGLATENRVVFDIDPAAKGLTFTALKVAFSTPDP